MYGLTMIKDYLDEILDGKKTYDARSYPTNKRGTIALVDSRTSKIFGLVDLINIRLISYDEYCNWHITDRFRNYKFYANPNIMYYAYDFINPRRLLKPIKARKTKDVFLMQYVKSKSFQISFGTPVTMDFCIKNKTHLSGFSSYTCYQNNARNLILKAGTGYTSEIQELHLYDGNNSLKFAFKHFHNYTSVGLRDESSLAKRSHSFFGLLYYSPNNDGVGEVHPNSPKN